MTKLHKTVTVVLAATCMVAVGVLWAAPAHAAGDAVADKLHAMVDELNSEQQAALLLLLSSLTAGEAPASMEKEPADPAAAFDSYLEKFMKAAKDEDIDALLGMVSEDFSHPEVGDKADLRDFLQNIIDMGYVAMYADEIEFYTEDAEFEQNGDEVIIYPLDVQTPMGDATIELVAVWEDGMYKISTADIY
ncbi:MAG: hypothetical protein ACLFTT_11895 [Candidatus Hydrogenedentota bacterium]